MERPLSPRDKVRLARTAILTAWTEGTLPASVRFDDLLDAYGEAVRQLEAQAVLDAQADSQEDGGELIFTHSPESKWLKSR